MQTLLAVILLGFFSASPAFPASDTLKVTQLTGSDLAVKVTGKDKISRNVKAGGNVQLGDEIATAKGQTARIASEDGHEWRVGPDSVLTLEARRTEGPNAFWVLSLVRGSFWGKAEKDPKAKDSFRIKIRTRYSALGVRGTEYLLGVDDKQAKMDVLEGAVLWGPSMAFTKESYKEVKSGEHGVLKADGKPVVTPSKGNVLADYGMATEEAAAPAKPAPETEAEELNPGECPRKNGTKEECSACLMEYDGDFTPGMRGSCMEQTQCPRNMGFQYQCQRCGQGFRGGAGKIGACISDKDCPRRHGTAEQCKACGQEIQGSDETGWSCI